MNSIREAVLEGAKLLAASPVPRDPGEDEGLRLDVSLILAFVLGIRRDELLARYSDAVADSAMSEYRRLVALRASGIPLAYVIGRKEFWGFEFRSDPRALVPRPDTELLVELALGFCEEFRAFLPGRPIRIHDACTGSGVIAVALKSEMRRSEISASDISSEALGLARENADSILGVDHGILFYQSDLLTSVPGSFDVVTANPPYVNSAVLDSIMAKGRNEPHIALFGGKDGLEVYRRLCPQAAGKLDEGGRIALEIGEDQALSVRVILSDSGFIDIRTWRDLAGRDRALTAVRGI